MNRHRCQRATCLLLFVSILTSTSATSNAQPLTDQQLQARTKVQGALRSEAVGDNVARSLHLAEALALDPDCPAANWHSGNVYHAQQWMPISDVQDLISRNPHTQQFRTMRAQLAGTVRGELELARWCLLRRPDVAKFYYSRLLASGRLDARLRQEAIKELELTLFRGRLIPNNKLADFKQAELLGEKAYRRWHPKLVKWHQATANRSKRVQQYALEEMKKVDDPYFSIVAAGFAASTNWRFASAVIDRVATFPEYEATQTLTAYALFSIASDAAARQLASRPKHDYVPVLLRQLTSQIDSDWEIVRLPGGSSVYSHSLYQKTPLENREFVAKKTFEVPPAIIEPRESWATSWSLDNDSKEIQREATEALQEQAEHNQKMIDEYNERVEKRNQAALKTLEIVTNEKLEEPSEWWDWWTEFNEIEFKRPTRSLTRIDRNFSYHQPYYRALSCFAAGTPVVTETGLQAIESIRTGDRVLTQDIDTGELRFGIVVDTTVRQPSPLLRLTINGQAIDTTLGHPFWVNNSGWKMAKLLQVGDYLHSVNGAQRIEAIEKLPRAQRAFNLIVQGSADYFVGANMLLVHDNTYRNATTSIVPGLAKLP